MKSPSVLHLTQFFLMAVLIVTSRSSAQEPRTARGSHTLIDAWLNELLDGDRETAIDTYRSVGDDEAVSAEVRVLSLARLAEHSRLWGDLDEVARLEVQLEQLNTDSGAPFNLPAWRRDLPSDFLADFLGQAQLQLGEAQRKTLRTALRAMEGPPDPRPYVARLVRQLNDLQARRNNSLMAQISEARSKGDQARVQRLGEALYRQGSIGRTARTLRRQSLTITEHHLNGDHERAERIQAVLSPNRRQTRRRVIEDRAQLQAIQRGIDQLLESQSLDPYERRVLNALDLRLQEAGLTTGGSDEAIKLLQRLPRRILEWIRRGTN